MTSCTVYKRISHIWLISPFFHFSFIAIIFSVKYFSGITLLRILKFGTNVSYNKLYCVLKNQPHIAYQSLYLSTFLSLLQNFLSKISQKLHCTWFRILKFFLHFSFSRTKFPLKVLQPLMATAGGMLALLTYCYILPTFSVPYIISLVFLAVFSSVLCLLPWKPLQDFFTVSLFYWERNNKNYVNERTW